MRPYNIVIDTNVLISTLRSQQGASFRLMTLLGSDKFTLNISVPLILEYEDVAKRLGDESPLSARDIDNILDYICAVSVQRKIYYLWRPFLKDPNDDLILELAVSANCDYILTYNRSHFKGIEQFGLTALTPKEFLQLIGELS